jgi:outer membrane immunogenic protein
MIPTNDIHWGIIMRRELLASVSAIALLLASASTITLLSDRADAADLAPAYKAPPPAPVPVYSWTGCYVGAQVGWGWGHNNASEHAASSFSGGPGVSRNTGVNTNGALFGGQVGCNYQFAGNWVIGAQGDFAGTDINGKANDNFFTGDDDSISVKTEWLASITGRLGWAFWNNQALVYVKGGGAWTRNQWDVSDAALFFQEPIFSETRSGWTVGGGFEWTLWSPNWTAFVEYNYYDFSGNGTTLTNATEETGHTFQTGRQEINTVKVGVNYKFNGWFGGP